MKHAKSSSPDSVERKKSEMQSHGSLRWRGNVKRIPFDVHDSSFQITRSLPSALAAKWPYATEGTRKSASLTLHLLAKGGPDPVLELRVVLAVLGPEAPLIAEQRGEVQVLGHLVERDAHATRVPRKGGGNSGLSAATSDRAGWPSTGGGPASSRLRLGTLLLGDLPSEAMVVLAGPLELDQAVHGAQALEGVAPVEQAAVVDLTQVAFDIGAGQRGTTEQDGDLRQRPIVQLDQVLAHDQGRLHQRPLMPMASASCSWAAVIISLIPTLIPRFTTS